MDLSVVDTFVRPDPVYTTNRAEDAQASVSFSDILQERIAAPAASESRADADRARQGNAASPAEKPEREIAAPVETQPKSPEKPAKADASTDSETVEHSEASDDAGNAEDAASTDAAATSEAAANVADAAAAVAKPASLLSLLPLPAANSLPVVVAEAPVVLNTDGTVPAEAAPVAVAPAVEPKTAAPVAATPTLDINAAPKADAPATPFTLEPATDAAQAASDAAKPALDANKQITAALPLVDDAAIPQPVVSQAVVQSAAIQAAGETVIAPAVRQADKPAAAASTDSAAPVAVELGSEAAGDVITVSVDDVPVADKAAQSRLAPSAGPVARGPETASPILTSTNGYAAQIAAQDPSAHPADAAPVNISTPETKTPAMASRPEIAAPSFELPVDASTAPTQTGTTNPLFATEQANLRTANAVSETAAANQAARSAAAHPVVEQVTVRVARAMADSVDRIRIQLNPIELGHIDVRMEIGPDGRFNAVFAADRPQTVEMLQRDARELARSLQDAGLRADTGSLSFNLRGEDRANEQNSWRGAGNSPATVLADAANDTIPAPLAYAGSSAGAGRVDIRV